MRVKIYRIRRPNPHLQTWANTWLQQMPQPPTLDSSGARTLSLSSRVFLAQATEVSNQLTPTVIHSSTKAWCQAAPITSMQLDLCQVKLAQTIFKCRIPSSTTILMRTSTTSMGKEGQWLVATWSVHKCELTSSIKSAIQSMTNSLQKSLTTP